MADGAQASVTAPISGPIASPIKNGLMFSRDESESLLNRDMFLLEERKSS